MNVEIKCEGSGSIALDSLHEFQGKLKELSTENYEKLKKEILELGFSCPFFVWRNAGKDFILDGHQRLRTLIRMRDKENIGMPSAFPKVDVRAKDIKEAKRKVLALTSHYGKMTGEGLYEFINEAGIDFDSVEDSFHFHEIDFKKFKKEFIEEAEPIEGQDDVPEKRKTDIKHGDIFILGHHRLLCGDSTELPNLQRILEGELIDMVFTDPPYNIDYEGKTKKKLKIQNDEMSDDTFKDFLFGVYSSLFESMKPGAPIYVCHADSERINFTEQFKKAGLKLSSVVIWNKNVSTFGRQDYFWKHEPILYGWKEGAAHKWYGPNNEISVWDVDRPSKSEEHPTMKPIALIERALLNSSKKGDLIFDSFLGSGSTLIASEKQKRRCYGLELDPAYCQVIIDRWEKFTGGKAIRYNENKIIKSEVKLRRKKA